MHSFPLACAAAALAVATVIPAASADDVCAGVVMTGLFGPPVMAGPVCHEVPGSTSCRSTDVTWPPVDTFLYTCTPR